MILRLSLLAIFSFFFSFLDAQDKTVLNNQDGVYVSCELIKIESSSKKDTYLAVVKAENKNDYDVFYSIPLTKQPNGTSAIGILENISFAQSSVRNSTGLFGDNLNITGNQTKLITNDNKVLYLIPKGNFVTCEKEFKVKKGVKPIITNTFLFSLKSIDNFDVAVNETTINGDWISNCGNISMTLSMTKNERGEAIIQQIVNGKQIVWRNSTANSFEKLNDKNATLSFNKQTNSFNYSTTDGVSCVWVKNK